MQTEYTAREISQYTGLTIPAIHKRAKVKQWRCINRPNTKGGGIVNCYLTDSLDDETRLAINKVQFATTAPVESQNQSPCHQESKTASALTEKQIIRANAKTDLLMHYMRAMKSAGYGKKAETRDNFILAYKTGFAFPELYKILGDVTWKAVENWKRTVRAGGGISDLSDRRGKWRKGKSIITSQQARILLECALHPHRWTISEVIREAQRRMHDTGINNGHSPATYRRWLQSFKEHNYDIWCFQRGGEKRFNDECCLSIERNPDLISVGDVLVADGHKLNFEILNPWTGKSQRMTLIVFYDMRSSYPCGWEIMPTENTVAISAALRRAILTLGKIPRVVYIDNGRAFKAKYFTETDLEQSGLYGLYAQLGIQTVFAWPYHGQSKTVERFFGVVAELERKSPTYVGTSIDKKPPRMNRGERLHRRIYENVMAGKYLTMEMAHQAIATWFDEYATRPQERSKYLKGYAPADLFNPGRGKGIDSTLLTYLMWSKKDASIRGSRISFQGRFYYHPELEGRRHKVEIRFDLQDPSYVAVFEDGELLCLATEQDKVHPMAILGTDKDREKLAKYCEIKARHKKQASFLARKILEEEVLPAHQRRLEMDGVTPQGPPPEPVEPEPKKLTAADEKRIQKEVAQYQMANPEKKPDIWAALEDLAEAERYEQLVRYGARNILIPREHQAFMRYFEQTGKYIQLEKTGYWENVRTAELLTHRAANLRSEGAING